MVAAEDVVIDEGVLDEFQRLFIDHKIIQSPPNVLGPTTCPHAPPRILHFFGIKVPKRIHPTIFQEFSKT